MDNNWQRNSAVVDAWILEAAEKGIHLQNGIIGNKVLYDLCEQYFDHTNDDAINAKIWLIGRAYAAAIERRRTNGDKINDDFYAEKVVNEMRDAQLDKKLKKLKTYSSITPTNIAEILEVHRYLLGKFKTISGLEKRSLASKYLHFHLPDLFFIFDSRANNALRRISEKPEKDFDDIINSSAVDKAYASFFYRAYQLRERIGKDMTPRHFDNMLIMIENEKMRGQKTKKNIPEGEVTDSVELAQ